MVSMLLFDIDGLIDVRENVNEVVVSGKKKC